MHKDLGYKNRKDNVKQCIASL